MTTLKVSLEDKFDLEKPQVLLNGTQAPVSYTHLTLPTSDLV